MVLDGLQDCDAVKEIKRHRLQRAAKCTIGVLRMLGVTELATNRKGSFWLRNEPYLHELYSDFVKRRRQVLANLHPDNGGDNEKFVKTNELCALADRQFRRRIKLVLIFMLFLPSLALAGGGVIYIDPTGSPSLVQPFETITFFAWNNDGSVITTGVKHPHKVASGGKIAGWVMSCVPFTSSITLDVLRSAGGSGPPTESIIGGGTMPAIANSDENTSFHVTDWDSVQINAYDRLAIQVMSVTNATYVQFTLYYAYDPPTPTPSPSP